MSQSFWMARKVVLDQLVSVFASPLRTSNWHPLLDRLGRACRLAPVEASQQQDYPPVLPTSAAPEKP
jgi:hypothetical protein